MTWRPHLALNGALKLKGNFHVAPHPLPSLPLLRPALSQTRQKTRAMAQMPVGKCSGKHSRQLPANNGKPIRKHLLDMVLLNVLACNTDAHAKNYSIMIRGNGASLAPMYDVMCGEVWENVTKNLAQTIAGERRGDYLMRTH
jgi:hypothetical protein